MSFGVKEPRPCTAGAGGGEILVGDGAQRIVRSSQGLEEILGCSLEEKGGAEEGDRGSGSAGL